MKLAKLSAKIKDIYSFNGRIDQARFIDRALWLNIFIIVPYLLRHHSPALEQNLLLGAVMVAGIVAMTATVVKRMHDYGTQGGWVVGFLLCLRAPYLYLLWLLVLARREGTKGANDYGRDPLRMY